MENLTDRRVDPIVSSENETPKQPYEAPQVVHSAPLEALASVCQAEFNKEAGLCAIASS